MNKVIFFFIIFVSVMYAGDPQYYAYIDLDYCKLDLFYQFGTVVGILDQYENNKYCGVKVDFGRQKKFSPCYKNGWEHFFKKLSIGNTTGEFRHIPNYEKKVLSFCLYELSFKRAHYLIKKYIEIQPVIREKVASYRKEFFDDTFVVGVCYMDDNSYRFAVPKIPYKTIYDMLLVHIMEKNNLKIFVYTNDKRFYSFLKVKHPDIVFEYKEGEHFETNMGKGEHELINCLLLSQADLLIRTPSRFGFTISQFNSLVPVIELDYVIRDLSEL